MSKDKLLFLVHRIPFPPNKGDKIRSYNFLLHLTQKYDVYLGAFVDSAADRQYGAELEKHCAEVCLVDLHPLKKKLLSTLALLTGEALSVRYFWSGALKNWVDRVTAENDIRSVLVFSSPMARYLEEHKADLRCVVDFVDVDSQKWTQYSGEHGWPMRWIYAREGQKLLAYEKGVATRSDRSVFVSRPEASLFQRLAPEASDRVAFVENGVDTVYFRPSEALENPFAADEKVLVFTGAMDYWANVDSVVWFVTQVFPAVREAVKGARFFIVGSNPTPAVLKLAQVEGVHVTGAVRDIRPYLQHAVAAVAPLRIARGVQNKVLEAMAMARPVIATPQAMEGIDSRSDDVHEVNTAQSMAGVAIELLNRPRIVSDESRAFITRHYDWKVNAAKMEQLIRGGHAGARL